MKEWNRELVRQRQGSPGTGANHLCGSNVIMKIVVPVKRVPDPYGRVRLTPDGQIDESDIKWVINPFDEIALEEAVRLRERGLHVEIVAVGIGGAAWEEQMRTALAM